MKMKIILPIVGFLFATQITLFANSGPNNKFYKIAISGDEPAIINALFEINEEATKDPVSYVNDIEALLGGLSIASKKNESLYPFGLEATASMFNRALDNSTVDSIKLSTLLLYRNPLFISSSILGPAKLLDWNNPNHKKALSIESSFLLGVQRKFNPYFQPDKSIFMTGDQMVLDSNGKNDSAIIKKTLEEAHALRLQHIGEYQIQQSCKRILDMCMPAFKSYVSSAIESHPEEIQWYKELLKEVGYHESEIEKISPLLK